MPCRSRIQWYSPYRNSYDITQWSLSRIAWRSLFTFKGTIQNNHHNPHNSHNYYQHQHYQYIHEKVEKNSTQLTIDEGIEALYNGCRIFQKPLIRYYGVAVPTIFAVLSHKFFSYLNTPMELELMLLGTPVLIEYIHCIGFNRALWKLFSYDNNNTTITTTTDNTTPTTTTTTATNNNNNNNNNKNEKLWKLIEFAKDLKKLDWISWRGIMISYIGTISLLYWNPFHYELLNHSFSSSSFFSYPVLLSTFPFFPLLFTLLNHEYIFPSTIRNIQELCNAIQQQQQPQHEQQPHEQKSISPLNLQTLTKSEILALQWNIPSPQHHHPHHDTNVLPPKENS